MTSAPFKDIFNLELVRSQGSALARAHKPFNRAAFVRMAGKGLLDLELKGRVQNIARAMRHHLPEDWKQATSALLEAMPPALPSTDAVSSHFNAWPYLSVVEEFGLAEPKVSLPVLREMTRVFSAEYAIRPLILQHPKLSYAALHRWVKDADPHVRRLASEGSRPRLPWGVQLTPLVSDPSPTLPLLEALREDPSEYVRRSVANHLNDISKDHPKVALEVCTRWSKGATPDQTRLIRHALRTLVKAGNPKALGLLGFRKPKLSEVRVQVTPKKIQLGESLNIRVTCHSDVKQALMMDLALVRPTKTGSSAKVFKGVQQTAQASEKIELRKALPIKSVTTRVYYPGKHRIEVLVNGQTVGQGDFHLTC